MEGDPPCAFILGVSTPFGSAWPTAPSGSIAITARRAIHCRVNRDRRNSWRRTPMPSGRSATSGGHFRRPDFRLHQFTKFREAGGLNQAEYKRGLVRADREFGDMPQAALDDPAVRGVFMDLSRQGRQTVRRARSRYPVVSDLAPF